MKELELKTLSLSLYICMVALKILQGETNMVALKILQHETG